MHYVYLIESLAISSHRYAGLTTDIDRRLQDHNLGKSTRLVTYVAFASRGKAEAFERYLKSGSGHAFAKKRLW